MARQLERNQTIVASVYDRLIDDEPTVPRDAQKTSSQAVRELKQAVLRDLQNLLNARCRYTTWPEDLDQIRQSIVNYGIPDFTASTLQLAINPEELLDRIADAIRLFEPRLSNVRVTLVRNPQQLDRTLRFRIDAVLTVDPISDVVSFNSILEPTVGAFEIERSTS